jgi:hypothetical protein
MGNNPEAAPQVELGSSSAVRPEQPAPNGREKTSLRKSARLRSGIRRLVTALRAATNVPAIVEFIAPKNYTVPSTFKLESFIGLLHCAVARTESDEVTVLTYWVDRRSYEAQRLNVISALGSVTHKSASDVSEMRFQGLSLAPKSVPDLLVKLG